MDAEGPVRGWASAGHPKDLTRCTAERSGRMLDESLRTSRSVSRYPPGFASRPRNLHAGALGAALRSGCRG